MTTPPITRADRLDLIFCAHHRASQMRDSTVAYCEGLKHLRLLVEEALKAEEAAAAKAAAEGGGMS